MSTQPEERYPSSNDASLRIYNSVLKYNGKYVWVLPPNTDSDRDNNLVRLTSLPENKLIATVSANDPLFEIESPALGWLQCGGYIYYITRAPYRKQKQGISSENLLMSRFDTVDKEIGFTKFNTEFLYNPGFTEMLNGKYRPYLDAYKFCLNNKVDRRYGLVGEPVSRDYCLVCSGKDILLYKRTYPCGVAGENGVKLYDNFNHSLNVMALADLGVALV